MKQGGGITRHEGVNVYIDLIVGDLSDIVNNYPQTAELFATFSKHRQGSSNFGYAEIDRDDRLHNALIQTKDGRTFYKKLHRNMPTITVSNDIIGNVQNIKNVKMFKLADLEKDPIGILNNINEVVCVDNKISDKNFFFDGIEQLNKILSIKPGFFGISININQIIDDWIQKKKKVSPSKIVSTCALCKEIKPLCDAHLVPRSFGQWLAKNNSFVCISDNKKLKVQTLQFDKGILCSDCDNKLGNFDDQFINFCRNVYEHPERENPRVKPTDINIIFNENTLNIQLGIVASLWRCSISRQCPNVDLGIKYNSLFRDWLWNGNIPNRHLCESLLISCSGLDSDKYILLPSPLKNNGFVYYFHLPGMIILTKIGNGHFFKPHQPLLLSQTDTVKLLTLPSMMDFANTSGFIDELRGKQ